VSSDLSFTNLSRAGKTAAAAAAIPFFGGIAAAIPPIRTREKQKRAICAPFSRLLPLPKAKVPAISTISCFRAAGLPRGAQLKAMQGAMRDATRGRFFLHPARAPAAVR
jgi:hypothetical protein